MPTGRSTTTTEGEDWQQSIMSQTGKLYFVASHLSKTSQSCNIGFRTSYICNDAIGQANQNAEYQRVFQQGRYSHTSCFRIGREREVGTWKPLEMLWMISYEVHINDYKYTSSISISVLSLSLLTGAKVNISIHATYFLWQIVSQQTEQRASMYLHQLKLSDCDVSCFFALK